MDNNNVLPEAPASITYSVVTPKGFPALVTLRDSNYSDLVKKMKFMEAYFSDEKHKYTPQVRGGYVKKEIEYIDGKSCPECGGRIRATGEGNKYWKCENNKYDFKTKTSSGCKFFTSPEKYNQDVLKSKQSKLTPEELEMEAILG